MKKKYFTLFFLFFNVVYTLYAKEFSCQKAIDKMDEIANNNIEEAIHYGDSILKTEIDGIGKIYNEIAWLYIKKHNHQMALENFKNAEKLFLKKDDYKNLAESYIGLGKIYSELDRIDEAIEYAHKASKLANNINDERTEAYSLILLSHIYFSLQDYREAIHFNHQARQIQISLKDSNALASSMNDLSILYERNKQIDSALYFNKKALELNKKLDKPYKMAISYNNIARIYKAEKKYNLAIENFKKSIAIHQNINANGLFPIKNLASVYLEMQNFEKAKNLFYKSLEIAKANKDIKLENKIYLQLLNIAIAEKDFQMASKLIGIRDSLQAILLHSKNQEKIKSIDNHYQQILKEEQLKQELQISKKNKIILIVTIGILVLFILFIFQRNRISKLKASKENMILEQKVLRTQMNPHFIFNALTAIQKTIFDGDALKSATYLSIFSKLIRQNFEFTNKRLISLQDDLDALKNYIETQQLRFEEAFKYEINIDKSIDVSTVKIPPMLLQPFVENAIEHGLKDKKQNAKLRITVQQKKDIYVFEIKDNGKGFDTKEQKGKREHAIDIFKKRLKIRNLGEEIFFKIENLKNENGTLVTIGLKL